MNRVSLYLLAVIITATLSCSGAGPSGPSGTSSEFCKDIQGSSNSTLKVSGISSLIDDICSGDYADINRVMYSGSGTVNIIRKEVTEKSPYSYVYLQGGLQISGVSSTQYFNMTKAQVSQDPEFSESYDYEIDQDVKYKVTSKTDTRVKYDYKKDINDAENNKFEYSGTADFVTIKDGSLYVITNKLDTSKENSDVKDMFSVSIITGTSSVSVFMGMTQTADNHLQHDSSVSKTEKFFKEDAKRSYKNALNYKARNK